MKISKRGIIALILLGFCILIHVYSQDSLRVEEGYSTHFYVYLSRFLRKITGPVPFSLGDILYGIFFIWLMWKLIKNVRAIRRRPKYLPLAPRIKYKLLKFFTICCILYILFNIFWGINYNRLGIASQLGLTMDKYSTQELKDMNCLLIDRINSSKQVLEKQKERYPSNAALFAMTAAAYDTISKPYPFLVYRPASIKPALWGWLGNFAGFTGYYNPFTGEAQVNTTVPKFLQPYVACHEAAHQVGYAKEMEANFVGYLAAAASKDTVFHYSVYLDLFMYANRNLFRTDSVSAKLYRQELIPQVNADLEEWRKFSRNHLNPAEPVIRWMYGKFLQGNQQPQGILSYDEVTAFIIAYHKKFGKI
jgi:hypothetical protein